MKNRERDISVCNTDGCDVDYVFIIDEDPGHCHKHAEQRARKRVWRRGHYQLQLAARERVAHAITRSFISKKADERKRKRREEGRSRVVS